MNGDDGIDGDGRADGVDGKDREHRVQEALLLATVAFCRGYHWDEKETVNTFIEVR